MVWSSCIHESHLIHKCNKTALPTSMNLKSQYCPFTCTYLFILKEKSTQETISKGLCKIPNLCSPFLLNQLTFDVLMWNFYMPAAVEYFSVSLFQIQPSVVVQQLSMTNCTWPISWHVFEFKNFSRIIRISLCSYVLHTDFWANLRYKSILLHS